MLSQGSRVWFITSTFFLPSIELLTMACNFVMLSNEIPYEKKKEFDGLVDVRGIDDVV